MTVRQIVLVAVFGAGLGACAEMRAAAPAPSPAQASAVSTTSEAVGHSIEDVVAYNGPPSQQWVLPDGRVAYRWESSSVTARVGASRNGEVQGAASQTTCYYTLYAKPDAKGVAKVVGAEEPRPGCLKLAMNGQAK